MKEITIKIEYSENKNIELMLSTVAHEDAFKYGDFDSILDQMFCDLKSKMYLAMKKQKSFEWV